MQVSVPLESVGKILIVMMYLQSPADLFDQQNITLERNCFWCNRILQKTTINHILCNQIMLCKTPFFAMFLIVFLSRTWTNGIPTKLEKWICEDQQFLWYTLCKWLWLTSSQTLWRRCILTESIYWWNNWNCLWLCGNYSSSGCWQREEEFYCYWEHKFLILENLEHWYIIDLQRPVMFLEYMQL